MDFSFDAEELVSTFSNSSIQNFLQLRELFSDSTTSSNVSSSSKFRLLISSVFITSGVKPHRIESAISLFNEEIVSFLLPHQQNQNEVRKEIELPSLLKKVIQILAGIVSRKDELKETKKKKSAAMTNLLQTHERHSDGIINSNIIEPPCHRIARSLSIYTKQRTLIVFLSGPSGAGKSSLASQLAHRLSIASVLSTDSIREALRSNSAAVAACPELASSTFDARINNNNNNRSNGAATKKNVDPALHVLTHFHKQCGAILAVLEKFVDGLIERGESAIVEGIHLVPAWVRMMMMNKYFHDGKNPRPILVPVFAFVGGTTRHMHRFSLRRNKEVSICANESEKMDRSNSNNNINSNVVPKNRYLNNFDQIRMIHHWYLSEIGKWFMHAEIGDYCDGGIGFHHHHNRHHHEEKKDEVEDDERNNDDSNDDEEVVGNQDQSIAENEQFFPRATSSTCLMLRAVSDNNNNNISNNNSFPQTPITSISSKCVSASKPEKGSPSRLWFRWRRRANAVVKLIRTLQQQSMTQSGKADDEAISSNNNNNNNLSPLTPILENISMDRSVNFAHQAVVAWLDAADLQSTCLACLPVDTSMTEMKSHESMIGFNSTEDFNDKNATTTNTKGNSVVVASSAIAAALQRRRREKARRILSNNNSFRKTTSGMAMTKLVVDHKTEDLADDDNNNNNINNSSCETHLTDVATSSGDDCGGSVGFEEHDSATESSSTTTTTTTSAGEE